MFGDIGDEGYLRINNDDDRKTVANILYKNGYTVQPIRRKKNGKAFEYYVKYKMKNNEIDSEAQK